MMIKSLQKQSKTWPFKKEFATYHSKEPLQLVSLHMMFKLELNGKAMSNLEQVHFVGPSSLFHTIKYFPLNIYHVHGVISV
jgi:hypothetical protein